MKIRWQRIRWGALVLGILLGGLPAYAGTGNYVDHRAVVGDFNGDGWSDIILQPLPGAHGTAELIAYPDGNFGAPLATWADKSGGTNWNAAAHRLVVGDFNGDGRDDVLLQGAAGLASQIAFARADGRLSQTDLSLPATLGGLDLSQATHHLVVGDFNGDGRDDVLLQANTFVGSDGVALATAGGGFSTLASKWRDGFHGLAWSQDRVALTAGDFAAAGRDELLLRSTSATGSSACCELIAFDKHTQPTRVVQRWAANYLGVDWQPATHLAIVGDFNGDGHADVLLQPRAPGGEVDIVLADAAGHLTKVSQRWPSERNGVDWSAESYLLVPEHAALGAGATLLMVPQQSGLPYRRAHFDLQGRLQSVAVITAPADNIFAAANAGTTPSAGVTGGVQPHVLAAATVPAGDAVGAMNGQASASNGVAGYAIKIAVPPGRAGMAPALSLGYSSNGGDGHEGVGWSLGGFSTLYRCPATQASDGHTAGTTFSTTDRFCLDGAKLMLSSGTYGSAGSVYHAEVNGFSKVVAHGSQGKGPDYFTVRTPGGRTLTYGQAGSAELLSPNGSIFSWSLTKSVDESGNEIDYTYEKSGGENWPTSIDYTRGNGSSGATRKLSFSWESRSAVGASDIVHYLAGMKQSTTRLLTHIKTWVGSAAVRDYTLSYTLSAATQRPLLAWVQTCAYNSTGRTCFNPTTFSYQGEHARRYVAKDPAALGLVDHTLDHFTSLRKKACTYSGYPPQGRFDVNGDGLSDLVGMWMWTDASAGFQEAMTIQYGQPAPGGGYRKPVNITGLNVGPAAHHTWSIGPQPFDFNLDGRTDPVIYDTGYGANDTYQGTDLKVLYQTNASSSGDFKLKDLGIMVGSGPTVPLLDEGMGPGPQVMDVNGDGKPDLVVQTEPSVGVYQWHVYLAHGVGNSTHYVQAQVFSAPGWADFARVLDYDADGRSDLLVHYPNAAHYVLLHSTGSGLASLTTNIPNVQDNGADVPIYIVDVNGDSLPDILEPQPVTNGWHWFIYLNTGASSVHFAAPIDTGIAVAHHTTDNIHGLPADSRLYAQVQVVRDPDGRQDVLMATQRTYLAPQIVLACGTHGGGKGCGPIVTTPSGCQAYDIRKDYSPATNDGYDWELYRPTGSGSRLTLSDWGQVGHTLEARKLSLDINSDGLPDLVGVRAQGPGPAKIVVKALSFAGGGAGDPMPDLLATTRKTRNGFGVTNRFAYQPLSDPAVYARTNTDVPVYPQMRFASTMQVVASLSETNPVGGLNTDTYFYQDAYYNVAGRGFEGFRTVTVHNQAQGTTTVTTYKQHFPYIGRVSQSRTSITQGATLAISASTWSSRPYGPSGARRYVVYAAGGSRTQYDPLANVQIMHSTMSRPGVDACGNPTGSGVQTLTTQQATQSTTTKNTYNGGNVNTCWRDTVATRTVTTTLGYAAVAANATPASSDTLASTTTYGYDGHERLISKDVIAVHNGSRAERKASYGYDGYGNRTAVTQNDVAAGTGRTTASSYGSDGYFPVSVTNALGQTATFTYAAATGNKTRATDPNGIATDYAFDAFGRKAGGRTPGAAPVVIAYLNPGAAGIVCPGGGANTPVYAVRRTQLGYPSSYTCFDAFGHALRTATQGFAAGSWVDTDTTYDRLGRVLTSSTPYYAGGAPAGTTRILGYDVLGRVTAKTVPAPTGLRTIRMNYSGLAIATTDTAGGITHSYTRRYDGLGRGNGHLVEVDDAGGTATYRYGAGGNLVRATDPLGHAILAGYDGFGDKLTLSDPDKGNWRYGYDGYGEQTRASNARGQVITTVYDGLGRALSVNDPADHRLTRTTYDTAPDGVGRAAVETVSENGSVSSTRRIGYDTAGRANVSEITTGGHTYLQGTHYDGLGHPDQQAYPALNGGSNQPPTVSASASPGGPVLPQTLIRLNAGASDPNGSWQLSYHWAQTSGPAVTLTAPDSAQATVTLPAVGTYRFTVTVSDGLSTASGGVTIGVEVAPTARQTPTLSPATSYTGSYSASWGAVSGATRYQLQESTNGGAWSSVYSGSTRSWSASGKAAGSYRYRVRGCNAVGCGGWGSAATEIVSLPPGGSTPALNSRPSYSGGYTVSWAAVGQATSYRLEQAVNGGVWRSVYSGGARAWSASGQVAGHYDYRVRGCSAVGCGSWGPTATETVAVPPGSVTPTTSPNPSYSGGYAVSWSALAGASSYQLQQAVSGGAWSTIYSGSTRSWSAHGKAAGSTRYRVRGCDAVGCGPWGGSVSETVSVPAVGTTPVASPNPSYSGGYAVSWAAVGHATSYRLEQSANGGTWRSIYSGSTRSWSAHGQSAGSYAYRVRGCATAGCGVWGPTATETVRTPGAATKPAASPNPSYSGGYSLSWAAVGQATSYRLEQSVNGGAWSSVYSGSARSWSASGKSAGSTRYRVRGCSAVGCGGGGSTVTERVVAPANGSIAGLSPNPSYSGHYTVSWAAIGRATSYRLQQSVNGGAWSSVYSGSARSWSASGKSVGSYHYRVRGCSTVGCGAWGPTATETVRTPSAAAKPAPSSNPSYSGGYSLSWAALAGATSYQLQQAVNGGAWSSVYSGGARSWSAHGKSVGSYHYRVRGCSAVGCGAWGPTATETVRTPGAAAKPAASPNPSYSGGYSLSWAAVAHASSYRLEQSVNGGAWSSVYSGTARSWSARGKAAGSTRYRVRGCDAVGCGSWGPTATETVAVPSGVTTPTARPNPSYSGDYTLFWAAVGYATSYRLEQAVNGGAWSSVYSGGSRSWSARGRVAGSYAYRVRGCTAVGCGSWGPSTTETVAAPPQATPPAVSPNPSGSGNYSLSWRAVNWATSYALEEAANGGGWRQVQRTSARSWSTSGRANGTYKYRVRGCDTVGCGAWSAVTSETVIRVPAIPSGLHHVTPPLLLIPGAHYSLVWAATANATSYQLARDGTAPTQSGISGTRRVETAPTTGGTTQSWRVRACNGGGCSGWSAPISVTTRPVIRSGGGLRLALAAVSRTANGNSSGSGPGPLVVDTAYSAGGYPTELTRASDGSVYATVAAMDAWGHATLVYEGGTSASTAAVILARGYDQATGLALSTEAGRANAAPIVHLITAWDGFDNLRTRTDQVNGSTESATYDALNRLAGSTTTLTGGASLTRSYRYDVSGNRTRACSGSTCSVYTYGTNGAGPHAVSAVNGNSSGYAYNASGEMTKDNGRSLTWSAFGKALTITRGNTTLTLRYGPGNRRTRKTVTGPLSETVTYLGGAERLDINGSLSIRRTLGIADIAIIDTGGAQSKRLYPIADHLGSTIAIADSSGSLIQGLAYADFGQRYSAGWGATLTTAQALGVNTTLSDRGYTGQESLDAIGLDDYNARLYDPSLGRFLSVDPLIGHPGSTQGINPYSYVANNPLNRTDPTGESSCSGTSRACITMPMGNIKTKMVTPLGSHIPQKVSVNMSTGAVSGALAGTDGHSIALSTDYNSMASFSPAHAIAANSTGSTNVSAHRFGNQSGGISAATSAQLSACSYNPKCQGVGDWNRTTAGINPNMFNGSHSGFKAALFRNGQTNAYALAFAGTDSLFGPDGIASAEQILGMRSPQFAKAIALTQAVKTKLGSGASLMLTGHSLGGGLAALGALYWGRGLHAITFNAEGLSNGTIDRYHLDMSQGDSLITAYHTTLDPLTLFQRFDPNVTVPGRSVSVWNGLFSSGHSISSVCGALGTRC